MGIKYCVPQTVHMDTTPEKRMKFAEVIIRKCDEVSALTNDLFLHALSDMDKLEMNMHEVKLCAFMRKAVAELSSDMDSVRLILPDSEWVISADEKRLMQLTENILNNAAKYGEMPVDITIRQKDNDTVQINFKDYGNGLYAWDIMEPWAISKFGSNVNGEEESVRVPAYLEAWFGSHESGTYGYLGYDIPWKQVVAGNIPQTLYIPSGCNLTLTNMEVLSSVHIIVENGGKLTLSDSVVQGIIDVQSGGTFSMNYDSFNNEFTTGASLCGQLRLADGAALENAAIYSHANYLANGDLTDRTTSEPVAVANGNVTVKGTVAILGDDGGSDIGQTALRVNGTLTLADKDTTLVAYGGSGKTLLYTDGGTAIDITEGSQITGDGKLVAIGGDVLWGNGGNAVSGKGTIATKKVFLQGATANTSNKAEAGKAIDGDVKVISSSTHIEDGTMISGAENDPLADLYWKAGINVLPPLEKFTTTDNGNNGSDNGDNGDNGNNGSSNGNTGNNSNSGNNGNPGNSGDSGNNGKITSATKTAANVNTVKTGDTNNVLLWAALFVVSCAGMAGITVVAKKRK